MEKLRVVSIQEAKPKQPNGTGPFKEGENVNLKSGGPLMCIEEPGPIWTVCTWFDDVGNRMAEKFRNGTLEHYVPKPKRKPKAGA